jgi:hypothetical protein
MHDEGKQIEDVVNLFSGQKFENKKKNSKT